MSNRVHLDFMTENQSAGSASWLEVYSLSAANIDLVCFVIKLNTNKMHLRITLDPGTSEECVAVDVSLEDFEKEFEVSKLDGCLLTNHGSKTWAYQPREAQWTNSGFKIEIKSESGNKKLESGYVEWSER